MRLERELKNLFKKYGRTILALNSGGEPSPPYQALLRPLRYKNKMYLFGVNTPIGYNSQGHYLYIGPPKPDLGQKGISVRADGKNYRVDRAEKVHKGDGVLYIWAVLREMTT